MQILAIDTSGAALSVALMEDANTRAEIFLNTGDNHSLHLMPAIKKAYDAAGGSVQDTDLFVCTQGPGSFTGLRTGVGTIKGLALATGKPVLGLSTLEVLAANIGPVSMIVCPLLDAQRGQVYGGAYQMNGAFHWKPAARERLADVNQFIADFNSEEKMVFLGSGALRYADIIKENLPESLVAAPSFSYVRASMAGYLGMMKFLGGARSDALTLAPRYLRLSEAERKLFMDEAPEYK